jgi:predicted DNA-binding transcriptional regulator AlpA
MGFEPTTFCMASRRSSQLSYSRAGPDSSFAFRVGEIPVRWRRLTLARPPAPSVVILHTVAASPKLDLAGLAEVAEILETSRTQAGRWIARQDFPRPVAQLKATRVWMASDVRRWRRKHWSLKTARGG